MTSTCKRSIFGGIFFVNTNQKRKAPQTGCFLLLKLPPHRDGSVRCAHRIRFVFAAEAKRRADSGRRLQKKAHLQRKCAFFNEIRLRRVKFGNAQVK